MARFDKTPEKNPSKDDMSKVKLALRSTGYGRQKVSES
jgi:hypothetical protein